MRMRASTPQPPPPISVECVNDVQRAPWTLSGEGIGALVPGRLVRPPLPAPVRRLPGPALLVAVRYADSPVGPYHELALGVPARLGLRLGFCVPLMVVTSVDSRVGGQRNWGFPKELGTLQWGAHGDLVELRWKERDITVCAHQRRASFPGFAPVRALQARGDGPVIVPGRLFGWIHPGPVNITVPAGDGLAPIAGERRGAVVRGLSFVVRPARAPLGVARTLLAPAVHPEPAMVLEPR